MLYWCRSSSLWPKLYWPWCSYLPWWPSVVCYHSNVTLVTSVSRLQPLRPSNNNHSTLLLLCSNTLSRLYHEQWYPHILGTGYILKPSFQGNSRLTIQIKHFSSLKIRNTLRKYVYKVHGNWHYHNGINGCLCQAVSRPTSKPYFQGNFKLLMSLVIVREINGCWRLACKIEFY